MTNDETFIPTPEHPQPSAPESPEASPGPVRESGDGYTIGSWGVTPLPNYECDDCPFSTLDLPVMEDHRKLRHAPINEPAEPQQRVRRRYMRRD